MSFAEMIAQTEAEYAKPASIALTADDDTDGFRMARLARTRDAIGWGTQKLIARLHDHEGTLSVYWKEPFFHNDTTSVHDAWGGQGEDVVEHHFVGEAASPRERVTLRGNAVYVKHDCPLCGKPNEWGDIVFVQDDITICERCAAKCAPEIVDAKNEAERRYRHMLENGN